MTRENPGKALTRIGFSEYEAKAYLALLDQSPANGYQIAKKSGVPRAKVYESLERLSERGAIVAVESSGSGARYYVPTDPRELLGRIRKNAAADCERAISAIDQYRSRSKSTVEVLWRVTSETDLISRGKDIIESSQKVLHLALWGDEYDALYPLLIDAADRGLKMAMVLYSARRNIKEFQKRGLGAVEHGQSKRPAARFLGRQFVLVGDMECCVTGSILPTGEVEGVYTLNKGLVINAVDLVHHEIYLERMLVEVGPPIWKRYGRNLKGLNPFDAPGSVDKRGGSK